MKKLWILLAVGLIPGGCTAPEAPEETADWSHLKTLVGESHYGVELLGWASGEEELNAMMDAVLSEDKYACLGSLGEPSLLLADHSDAYDYALWLIVPNTDYEMNITIGEYDWKTDNVTGTLYEGSFDRPLLLAADDAYGDRNIRILAVDRNAGEFYYFPFININSPQVNTDCYMGIIDITDYDRLYAEDFPSYKQGLFDCVSQLPEVRDAVLQGYAFVFLWEMGVNGHNHVIYALYDGADVSSSDPKVFYALRPGDPDILRSEDLAYWIPVQE